MEKVNSTSSITVTTLPCTVGAVIYGVTEYVNGTNQDRTRTNSYK
jgi:hypothetical protein